ncbi:ROK family transcriptional regulator [Mariluticola halotolerans]|uniref:ROK family transcriptional regulator n=1 Tax=Mariluticola halotolerans TaxID=2909283 RepID=UPI0026E1BD04|nr:ROK family transcriptional regulator [Mariluticola halotolerans]UJQ93690.1 ROK family transcriptional regulator [Mariluticola halotolerans]
MNKNPSFSSAALATRRSSRHGDMRRRNESTLLSLIRRHPGLSSADLARGSGIAPQTVSVLLKGLEEQAIIIRGDAMRGRRGQPAVPIRLNPEGGYGIGVEIGWRHVSIVLLDLCGRIVGQKRREFPYVVADGLIADISVGVRQLIAELSGEAQQRVRGLGVACPSRAGSDPSLFGASPAEMAALETLDVAGELQRRLEMPVVLLDDGGAACRAECTYGRGAEYGHMLYMFIGAHIASGIFVGGRVIEGRAGDAGNLGAAIVCAADGAACPLHMVASVKALETRLLAKGKPVPRLAPSEWAWEALSGETMDWIEEAACGLAGAIANSCTVIDFPAVILDGILPQTLLDHLGRRTQASLNRLAGRGFEPPMVKMGRLGMEAPAIGAANMPIYLTTFASETGLI